MMNDLITGAIEALLKRRDGLNKAWHEVSPDVYACVLRNTFVGVVTPGTLNDHSWDFVIVKITAPLDYNLIAQNKAGYLSMDVACDQCAGHLNWLDGRGFLTYTQDELDRADRARLNDSDRIIVCEDE